MAAALQAISNGNMFRDMSGLAATIGLAQAGLTTTSDAATAAGAQAGTNLATAAKKEVEMFKAALSFAAAMMGRGQVDTSPSTISNEGAKINQGRRMDQRGSAGVQGGGQVGGDSPGQGAGTGGDWGGDLPPPGGGIVAGAGSNEAAAFQRALGVSPDGGPAAQLQGLLQNVSASDTAPATMYGERYVYFLGLSTAGQSAVVGAPLGINPDGAINNAVDIRAQALPADHRRGKPGMEHLSYRFRQTAQQRSWELVDGVWNLVYATKSAEPDDPDHLARKIDLPALPFLRMYDSPGWPIFVQKSQRTLTLGAGRSNDANAMQVVVQMYFITWVEGQTKDGAWERVSDPFEWISVQSLKRNGPQDDWVSTAGTRVGSGPQSFQELRSPADIPI